MLFSRTKDRQFSMSSFSSMLTWKKGNPCLASIFSTRSSNLSSTIFDAYAFFLRYLFVIQLFCERGVYVRGGLYYRTTTKYRNQTNLLKERHTINTKPYTKIPCSVCGAFTSPLSLYPNNLCIVCWGETPESKGIPTTEEIKRWFGIA